ncbi:MAG: plasmid stabilization system protein [Moraxellaceae bacterium]|nr:MAG: plasmid stabilization system protein [Moraxellaceae bacterium]
MKLEFTHVALNDLKRLRQFIAKKNPQAARRYSERLQYSLRRLMDHPGLGRTLDELPNVRELVAGDYVARYVVKDDRIIILNISHEKEER